MAWYNPFSWFKKEPKPLIEIFDESFMEKEIIIVVNEQRLASGYPELTNEQVQAARKAYNALPGSKFDGFNFHPSMKESFGMFLFNYELPTQG